MNYTITVPSGVASGKEARGLLEKALDLGLEPSLAQNSNIRKLSLYLPTVLSARLAAHPSQIAEDDLIRGLISAAIAHRSEHSATPILEPVDHHLDLRKWNLYRTQQEMVAALSKGIRENKITLLEGSTGIGKSRVMARTALELPAKAKVGIFAPTLAILYQLFSEFLKTARALKTDLPAMALYIGRRNFVGQQKLEKSISTSLEAGATEAVERARSWIKQGGPPITKACARGGASVRRLGSLGLAGWPCRARCATLHPLMINTELQSALAAATETTKSTAGVFLRACL
jgi:hypothetical protein